MQAKGKVWAYDERYNHKERYSHRVRYANTGKVQSHDERYKHKGRYGHRDTSTREDMVTRMKDKAQRKVQPRGCTRIGKGTATRMRDTSTRIGKGTATR